MPEESQNQAQQVVEPPDRYDDQPLLCGTMLLYMGVISLAQDDTLAIVNDENDEPTFL